MEELKEDVIEKLRIRSELNYIKTIRTNFSKQADEIVEKIKNGCLPTSLDYFILVTTDQKKIDQAIKFDSIRDKIAKGRIQHEDIDFLVASLGNVGEFKDSLIKSFYKRADENNLIYAQAHKEEFTEEEIQERIKKAQEHQLLEDILEENLL